MNHRSWEKREFRSERCDRSDDERWRAMRSHQTKTRAIPSIALVDRAAHRRNAIVRRAARSTIGALRSELSLLSLSLWSGLSLFSLSLFPEMNWSENESVNSFPSQRRKFWSAGIQFPENCIFRCNQTCGKGWKWFPEIIFTQNKRTLNGN